MTFFDLLSFDILLILLVEYIALDSITLINLRQAFQFDKGTAGFTLNSSYSPLWKRLLFNRLCSRFCSFGIEKTAIRALIFDNDYDSYTLFVKLSCLERVLIVEPKWEKYSDYAKIYLDLKYDTFDGQPVFEGFHPILLKILTCTYTIKYILDPPPSDPTTIPTPVARKLNIKFTSLDLCTTKLCYHTGNSPEEEIKHIFEIRLERWLDPVKYGPDADLDCKVQFLEYFFVRIDRWFPRHVDLFGLTSSTIRRDLRFLRAILRKIINLYSNNYQVHILRQFCMLGYLPEERGKRHLFHYRLAANPYLLVPYNLY